MKYRQGFLLLWFCLLLMNNASALLFDAEELRPQEKSKQNPSVDRYVDGVIALSKNKLTTAKNNFSESYRLNPEFPLPLIGLADVALRNQQKKEALSWLQKALDIAPNNPHVYQSLGRFYSLDGKRSEAESAFQKAISLNPNGFSAHLDLADFYINILGNPEKAVAAYQAALNLNPVHAGAYHGLGMVLAIKGETAQAIVNFHKAIELAPTNPLPRQALGRIYHAEKQNDNALQEYDEALRIQKDFLPALIGKGDIYLDQGNFKRALHELQHAANIAAQNDQVQLKLGMALQGLGRFTDAEKAYLTGIQLNPDLALAYNNLAWMAAENKNNLTQALQWAHKAVDLSPKTSVFHDTLAWVYRAQGKLDAAEKTLSKAVEMQPQSAEIYHHLGMVYLEQKKLELARKAFQQAIEKDKNHLPTIRALNTFK